MELWIYDTSLQPVGLVTSATSVLFNRSLSGIGTVEVRAPASLTQASVLRPGRILRLGGRSDMGALLTARAIETTREGQTLTVTGVQLKGLLSSRVIVPPTATEDATAYGYDRIAACAGETVLRHYIEKHAIHPTDTNRALPLLALEESDGERGTETPWSARWSVLSDELEDICEWTGIGYNIDLELGATPAMRVKVIPGRDLSAGVSRVVFSPDFRTVYDVSYTDDPSAARNTTYALGAGEDEDQVVRIVYTNPDGEQAEGPITGFARTESTLSVGNLSDPEEIDAETTHSLQESARELRTLTATVRSGGHARYRTDWDLGDKVLVQLRLPALGETVSMAAVITNVLESYERGSAAPRLDVTFGSAPVTVSRAIQRQIRRV